MAIYLMFIAAAATALYFWIPADVKRVIWNTYFQASPSDRLAE
jgi:hypothetical protein